MEMLQKSKTKSVVLPKNQPKSESFKMKAYLSNHFCDGLESFASMMFLVSALQTAWCDFEAKEQTTVLKMRNRNRGFLGGPLTISGISKLN